MKHEVKNTHDLPLFWGMVAVSALVFVTYLILAK